MARDFRGTGFTLSELIVVVFIVGLLAALAVPSYLRSVENSKAEEGVAMMNMVATTNRMYALDHGGAAFTLGLIDNGCNGGACTSGTGSCELLRCKYLAPQDWDTKAYVARSCDGAGGGGGCCSGSAVACVSRRTGGTGGTGIAPYNGWGYRLDPNGSLATVGGAPQPMVTP